MNRREAFAFLASVLLVAKTTATFPSEKELLYLAAGRGLCEGTFDNESPEADEICTICPPMVERGWMERQEGKSQVFWKTTELGAKFVEAAKALDVEEIARLRRGDAPWGRT